MRRLNNRPGGGILDRNCESEVDGMLMLVVGEVRDSIVQERVPRLREEVARGIQRIAASGKLKAGGILGGKRAGFFLLEVEDPKDVLELLGGEIIDNMKVQIDPVVSFEDLAEYFAKDKYAK